jgi:hypothetical protein
MSLPAPARHRWGLELGGEVGAIDMGSAVLLVPGGARSIQKALANAIADGRYSRAVAEIDDPDLQTQ